MRIPRLTESLRLVMPFWASPASPYYRDYFQEDRRTVVFCAGGGRSVLAVLALGRLAQGGARGELVRRLALAAGQGHLTGMPRLLTETSSRPVDG